MTSPIVDPQIIKRLAFIRMLHQQGVDQSRRPEPMAVTSILLFHDAVELFLVLSAEQLGAQPRTETPFMEYWDVLGPGRLKRSGVELSGKVGMQRLNDVRKAFKHRGTMPGSLAIEQARADVAAFFDDNTPKVFGRSYADISMVDAVPQPGIRDKVKDAVATNADGDRIEAMALLVEVFDELFREHNKPLPFRSSPFSLGPNIRYRYSKQEIAAVLRQPNNKRMPVRGSSNLAEQIDTVTEVVNALQGAMRVTVLGLDYRQYHRFRQLTPSVYRTGDRKRHLAHSPDYAPTEDEFGYCQEFVIAVALRLAELEAYTVAPSWSRES